MPCFAGSNQGAGFELTVIAAVVIGGTNLMGGTGSIFGTVAGALLLGTLRNILILNNVDPNKQPVITAIIIAGIALILTGLAPTFLLAYLRRAKREDFASLRLVITGADGSGKDQRAYGGATNDFGNGVAVPAGGGYLNEVRSLSATPRQD